jgi:hypothetical protein
VYTDYESYCGGTYTFQVTVKDYWETGTSYLYAKA